MNPEKVAVVRRNLKLLGLPQDPDPVQVYAEFGRVMVDYFYAGAHPLERAIALVNERKGFAHLQAAQAEGNGALFLSPHLSFFELGGVIMKDIGVPLVALTNPEPTPELTAWRAGYRLRWGVETIEVGHDQLQFVKILKELAAGKFVVALFDRPHPTQSFTARVPGGLLPCSSGILLLALLGKCPVIPVTVVVKPNGKYTLEALPPSASKSAEPPPKLSSITLRLSWMPCFPLCKNIPSNGSNLPPCLNSKIQAPHRLILASKTHTRESQNNGTSSP
jgi:KDO2-lipid IV(A) lauroyltransferase